MNNRRVFVYCSGIDDVLQGASRVAGIQVQMSFWARIFADHGWYVYSFTDNKHDYSINGIHFVSKPSSSLLVKLRLRSLLELIECWRCIIKCKPSLVITRGASRRLFFLIWICRFKKTTIVQFGASDTDFIRGKELLVGSKANRKMYQNALHHIDCFVVQNAFQQEMLERNYGKASIVLPNIWIPCARGSNEKGYDAVWVSNLRPLKRAEWFINLASELPQYSFAIVGGPNNEDYYKRIESMSKEVSNLEFMGAKPFTEVNSILSSSRLLICTSEFEGFPNTFLQAWSQGVPVISTVNPSNLISDYSLGKYVQNQEVLKDSVIELLTNDTEYRGCVSSIEAYFSLNHSAENGYKLVVSSFLKDCSIPL